MFAARAAFMAQSASFVKGSAAFNGAGAYLSIAANSAFSYGTSDFTVEAWVRLNNTSQTSTIVTTYFGGGASEWELQYRQDSGNMFVWGHGDNQIVNRAYSTANTWLHVAFSRQSTAMKMFFNGTQQGSTVFNSQWLTNTNPLYIGALTPAIGQYFNGYISNLRIVKGTAVYTSNFSVPTTPLTAISGTSLLTCQSPTTITDASTNAFTITAFGDAAASSLSPFA